MMGKRLRRVWGESRPFAAGGGERWVRVWEGRGGKERAELGKPDQTQKRDRIKTDRRQQSASASGYKLICSEGKRRSNKRKNREKKTTTRSFERRDADCCSCPVRRAKEKIEPARERERTWGEGEGVWGGCRCASNLATNDLPQSPYSRGRRRAAPDSGYYHFKASPGS